MKKILFSLALIVSLISAPQAPADPKESHTLRVVHWNVFYDGKGTDGIRDRGRQVATLAALKPDVITLNEVTANAVVDYAVRLQRATGEQWRHHYSSATRGGWGNAILSRYPLMSTSVYTMRVGQSRSVAQATLEVNGSKVNIFATHLDSGNHARSRAAQAGELLVFLEQFSGPDIFAGDMNAGPDAQELQPLTADHDDMWMSAVHQGTARGYAGNAAHRYTRTRRGRIDYIFASRDVVARECEVPDLRDLTNTNLTTFLRTSDDAGVRPSDHNLVTCVLEWKAAPAGSETPDTPANPGETDTVDPGDTDKGETDPGETPDGDVVLPPADSETPDTPDDSGESDTVDPGDMEDEETDPEEEPGEEPGEEPEKQPEEEPKGDVVLPPAGTCDQDPVAVVNLAASDPPALTSHDDIVLRPGTAATLVGNWIVERDCNAAGGARVVNPDMQLPKSRAVAEPLDYMEMTFTADAHRPYRLWIRAKADGNSWRNDSVSVQFSGAVDALGVPVYRIGTPDRTLITLEDCIGCGVSAWGWQDNGFGAGVLGPEIFFETAGPQTIRIQRREDGITIDQVVLSATTWLSAPPGALKDDATILPQ